MCFSRVGHKLAEFVDDEGDIGASPAGEVVGKRHQAGILSDLRCRSRSAGAIGLGEEGSSRAWGQHWVAILHLSAFKENFHSVFLGNLHLVAFGFVLDVHAKKVR